MLIDTSVLIALFRDRSGIVANRLRDVLDGRDYCLSRFTQMELLQGARDEKEWLRLSEYLSDQDYLEMDGDGWHAASRLYFDLRRKGLTVRSVIDCCIAELALTHKTTLLHNDRDFETIARVRSLKHVHLDTALVQAFHEDPVPLLRDFP